MNWSMIGNLRLRNAPMAFKCLGFGYLFAIWLGYLYALGNIALVVGLTPKDIAVHYYGASKPIMETTQPTGEQSLDLEQMEDSSTDAVGPRPTFKSLVGEGHFHLFGMSGVFFGLCVLALFTALKEKWKALLIGGSFFFIILDNISFMATRFLGPKFSLLTAVSGGFMGLCFLGLWFSVALELFKSRELK